MAVKSFVRDPDPNYEALGYKWLTMANGDTGDPVEEAYYSDRSVQVTGTFGTGGSITMQGSNDGGTTWFTLLDPAGAAVTFTAAGGKQIVTLPRKIRPNVTAGDGTTSLNVYLFMVGKRR